MPTMISPASPPPALTSVAQQYQQTSRGIVVFEMHRVLEAHGAFSSHREDVVMSGIYDDGALVKVRVSTYTINGKPAGANQISALEQSWEHPDPRDVFAAPFSASNFAAYAYRDGGPSTIDFASPVRDAGHGNGSFMYDAQNNVVSCTYQPNALPPHASSGEITDRRSEVLPGYWAVTQELQQYSGSYGPFSAAGGVQETFSGFRRFSDLRSALAAL
ncbi:MAG TPA: hypothetical protein VFF63_08880 [Candidatus Babeliales bacterium]|nr:hypothetical protein [Candidatus Babeliales bacterium]